MARIEQSAFDDARAGPLGAWRQFLETRPVDVAGEQRALIGHGGGQLERLATRPRAQVDDPFAGLRVQRGPTSWLPSSCTSTSPAR